MGGFRTPFPGAGSYDYGPTMRIGDMIRQGGQTSARRHAQSGQNWGNTLANLGGIIGQGVYDVQQERKEKQAVAQSAERDAAYVNFIQNEWQGDPKELMAMSVHTYGPEQGLKYAEGTLRFSMLGEQEDPKQQAEDWAKGMQIANEMPEPMRARVFPQIAAASGPVLSRFNIPPEAVGQEYSPETWGVGMQIANQILGKREAPLTQVSPGATLYDPEKGEAVFTAPRDEKPETRELRIQAADALASGDMETYNRLVGVQRQFAEAGRAPEGPGSEQLYKVDEFNPETGQMETRFITKGQATAMAQGEEPGIVKGPSTLERNRMAAANSSIEAGENLLAELKTPEFASAVGPAMGRYNSLIAAAGAGDPNAQYLVGALKGFAALQPQIHGFRATKFAEDIEHLLTTKQTPEALAAGLKGILTASYIVAKKKPGGHVGEEEKDPVETLVELFQNAGSR